MSDTQEKLFAMMAIVEEQQKAVASELEKLTQEREGLARERVALAEQVRNVAELTASEVVKSLSDVPDLVAGGINKAGAQLVASVSDGQEQIRQASEQLEKARSALSGRLFVMMLAAMLAVIIVAFVSQWGVTKYYQKQADEAQQSYEYWSQQAGQKYTDAQHRRK